MILKFKEFLESTSFVTTGSVNGMGSVTIPNGEVKGSGDKLTNNSLYKKRKRKYGLHRSIRKDETL